MSESHSDAGRSGRGILSRRGLFFGAGAALVAAAGGLLYRHLSSTSDSFPLKKAVSPFFIWIHIFLPLLSKYRISMQGNYRNSKKH